MTQLKCPKCGKTFNDTEQVCPNCGCPAANQAEQVQQETNLSQDRTQQNTKDSNKKKLMLAILSIMIVGIVAIGAIWYFGHSYEIKMAQFEKKANAFKATLAPDNQIILEIIDSIAQKVYYIEKNE